MENLEIFLDYIGDDSYVYRYNYDSKKYYNTGICLKGSPGNPGRPGRNGDSWSLKDVDGTYYWFKNGANTGIPAQTNGGASTNLAKVAETGSYNDLTNKPTIPTVPTNVSAFNNDAGYLTQHQNISGKADKSEMSVTDGTGADADKTTITLKNGTSATVLKSHQDISGKQDALVSGTNIKTINNESILGSGNISVAAELPSNLAYTSNDDGDGIVPDEYYFCDTAAATVTKTVLATDYVLSTGGSIKIKMIHDNTANDATLNVNNTGAKPLFYADKRASNSNSWNAGEIIEVYYDGTSYYANNVAGGSGDGVYDISAKNNGATYDNLAAALGTNGANVPASKRKGGMSVKFIQNIYATYNVVKTEGLDTQPTGTELQSASTVTDGTYTAAQLTDFSNAAALPSTVNSKVTYYFAVITTETVEEEEVTTTTYTTWVVSKITSDNGEYVQYTLTTSLWSIDTANWISLNKIKDNIYNGVTSKIESIPNINIFNGLIRNNGVIDSHSTYKYTNKISVEPGDKISTVFGGNTAFIGIAAYQDNTFILNKSVYQQANKTYYDYIVPDGVNLIRVSFDSSKVAVTDFYISKISDVNILYTVKNLETNVNAVDDIVRGFTSKPYFTKQNNGYINLSGTITSASNYRYTDLIPVQEDDVIDTIASGNYIAIAAYSESDTTIANLNESYVGTSAATHYTYKVPKGISYIRISFATAYVDLNNFYVNITRPSLESNVVSNTNYIKTLKIKTASVLTETEQYIDKAYRGSAMLDVSGATLKKYDVSSLDEVFVSTTWLSAEANFYMVYFFDANDNIISSHYINFANKTRTLTDENIIVPQGASYMYVNSRYSASMPIVKIPFLSLDYEIKKLSTQKSISILFIGNSLTQDAVSYVPLLLKELAPTVDFKFYIWYNGGYTLAQHLEVMTNDENCVIFSACENSIGWHNSVAKMSDVLSNYKFDIVCLQEYFNYQESASLEAFNGIIEYIENNYSYPFKVVTLFHQPKRDSAQSIFARTKTGNALLLKETVAEDMIPSGIAIYRALSTDLDALGSAGHLSPDGTHAQEGLPCMMQAYVTAMWILKQVDIPMSVNNASSIVNNDNYDDIHVPGPNGSVIIGTEAQVRLSQRVAINAFKEGEYFVNANLTEYTT